MVLTNVGIRSQQSAPCGQVVDAETFEDSDGEVLVTQAVDYACGCRQIRHEYHDGSITRKVIRHDGTVLVDELLCAE
jgi:hypothetical protein